MNTVESPSFFVVGTGRSGTTLVRTMLTGHPRIVIPGETGFLPSLVRLRRLWWSREGLRPEVFLRLAFANGRLARAGLDPREVSSRLTQGPPYRSYVDVISRLYASFCTDPASQLVGDKTPGYIRHLPLLTSTFGHARVVHVVRHPLDVVASLRQQPWGPGDVRAGAMMWRLDQLHPENSGIGSRLHRVRLEDLVLDPAGELSRIADHLGLQMHPQMMAYQERAARVMEQNVHPQSHSGLQRPLNTTARWSSELTPREAAAAWGVVAPIALRLGYEGPTLATSEEAGERDLAVARARLVAFHVARSRRRIRTIRRAFKL